VFADEKGYLVTEQVWEEVTDDEVETLPKPSKSLKTGDANAKDLTEKDNKSALPTKKKVEAKVGQKSISSFFGKK
jgi:hypothetical protein